MKQRRYIRWWLMLLVKFYSRLQVNNMAYRSLLLGVIEMVGSELSYIDFLHQTTTFWLTPLPTSLLSYIVFLHQTTTAWSMVSSRTVLSYIVFLHQTTTQSVRLRLPQTLSYIVFLHQTTTVMLLPHIDWYCLISSFYIKPQPLHRSPW